MKIRCLSLLFLVKIDIISKIERKLNMEYIELIGIAIIVIGFALKFDVLATVLIAGIATGLDFVEILGILGESFVKKWLMSIFLVIFPTIAITECYDLKERSAHLIGEIKNASAGKLLGIHRNYRRLFPVPS